MSKNNYYIHLMDGSPAYWDKEDKCLYFIPQFHKLKASDILLHSLKEIKEHQKQYHNRGNWNLSYLRVPAGWSDL